MESKDWILYSGIEPLKTKIQLSDRWYQLILNLIKLADLNLSKSRTTILEIGCGRGGFCIWTSNKCESVIGLDIGKKRIKTANKLRKRFLREVGFVVADAQHLPFKKESYDIIVCAETLEHVPDYRKVFNEMVRVTKKYGHIVVTVPNYINSTRIYRFFEIPSYLAGKKLQPDDLHRFNIFTVNRLFERKNLKVKIKRGIGLIYIPSVHPKIKSLESSLNKPFDKLKFLCINIGVIAQKTM